MSIAIWPQNGSVGGLAVILIGDGSASSLAFDLQDVPFSINIKGNPPNQAFVTSLSVQDATGGFDTSFTATASMSKAVVTVTFNKPLPSASSSVLFQGGQGRVTVNLAFSYNAP